MGKRILIVEDDADVAGIVRERLAREGLDCIICETGIGALRWLSDDWPDVLVCDLMLPDCPGETVVRYVRADGRPLPILIMSARSASRDKVDLLSLGADDYISKPFDLDELAARVAVQLRHSQDRIDNRNPEIKLGRWVLNEQNRTLAIDGKPTPLTKTEFDLLLAMARHPKRVFTRPELFEAVWGEAYAQDAKTVNVHVSNIRSKLKPSGTDSYIDTVWGVGFRVRPEDEDGDA